MQNGSKSLHDVMPSASVALAEETCIEARLTVDLLESWCVRQNATAKRFRIMGTGSHTAKAPIGISIVGTDKFGNTCRNGYMVRSASPAADIAAELRKCATAKGWKESDDA